MTTPTTNGYITDSKGSTETNTYLLPSPIIANNNNSNNDEYQLIPPPTIANNDNSNNSNN